MTPLDAEYEVVPVFRVVLGGGGFAVPNGARESSDALPRLVGPRRKRGAMFERSERSTEPQTTQTTFEEMA